jgi:SAM-dependent methyltransferase
MVNREPVDRHGGGVGGNTLNRYLGLIFRQGMAKKSIFTKVKSGDIMSEEYLVRVNENNFDEKNYLLHNQDVADAVKRGAYASGKDHFQKHPHENRVIGYDLTNFVSPVGLTTKLPPPELVLIVNGHVDVLAYAQSRRESVLRLIDYITKAGLRFENFKSILDFGCGCGRVISGFEGLLSKDVKLYGCDINSDLVSFAQNNIPFADVALTGHMPPLPYATGQFDLVYSSSVYTHMSLAAMLQWTGELARVVKPGGVAMISHHGTRYAEALERISSEGSRILAERGYYVHRHVPEGETWEGSNDYATFASSDFMRTMFRGFEVLRIFPGISYGPNEFCSLQDLIVFRRLAD